MSEPDKSKYEKPQGGKWLLIAVTGAVVGAKLADVYFPELIRELALGAGALVGLGVFVLVRYLIRKRRSE